MQLYYLFSGYINEHRCKLGSGEAPADVILKVQSRYYGEIFSQCERKLRANSTETEQCPDGWIYTKSGFSTDGTITMQVRSRLKSNFNLLNQ